MKVFLLTQISDLIYDEILSSPGCMVVSPNAQVSREIESQIGILCHMVNPTKTMTTEEVDKDFALQFMPGMLENLTLGTMPLYKTLSIDRLRFWFDPIQTESVIDYLYGVNITELVVPLDLTNPMIWGVAGFMYGQGVKVTGIKTAPLRTREFLDFYRYAPLHKTIVSFKDEMALLQGIRTLPVEHQMGDRLPREELDKEKGKAQRKGLNFSEDQDVIGVIYDKRDEWQFLRLMYTYALTDELKNPTFLIFAHDDRSKELFYKAVPMQVRQSLNLAMVDTWDLMHACNQIVMFRVLESAIAGIPGVPVTIYDFHNLNSSQELGNFSTGLQVII